MGNKNSELLMDVDKYDKIVRAIESNAENLARDISKEGSQDLGTDTINSYLAAQDRILGLVELYSKHLDKIVKQMDIVQRKKTIIDTEAMDALIEV